MSTTESGPRLRVVQDGERLDDEETTVAPAVARTVLGEVVPGPPEAVHGPAAPAPEVGPRPAELQPVIPAVLRDPEQRGALVAHWWAHGKHAAAFHTVRIPKYAARAAGRAPIGLYRATGMALAFVSDTEGRALRQTAVIDRDSKAYLQLVKERNARIRRRAQAYGTVAFLAGVTGLVAWLVLPGWALLLAATAAVGALAHLGSPPGRPILESSVTTFEVPRLTHPMIEAALASLGIGLLSAALRAGQGLSFPSDVARDGHGWRAEVDLPLGVTAGDILDKRDRLASALRRPLGTVWPEGEPDVHEGRLVVWVGDRDLAKAGVIAWNLAKAGTHDVFKPFMLGRDPRGRTIEAPLIYENYLIGAMPRQGKTAAARVISCAAALDPTCELWLHELKGTGDLDGLEQVSHRYVSGIDEPSVAYAAESLAMLKEEAQVRGERLKSLPRDLVPDKKVTRQVANRRSLGLYPILCVVDECQNLFADKEHGKQAGLDAEYLIKIGPALGIILVLATQRPDKDSLPTGISGNVSQRLCFHVAGQVENDMILGTSAYKSGHRATMFRPGVEAGIGIQKGAGPRPFVVKVAYVDGPSTAAIGKRARLLREAAGTLSGHAAGQDTDREREPSVDIPRDVLTVFELGEKAAWNELLLERLVDLRPGFYDGWTSAQLTAALKARGIDVVKDVFRERKTRRGIHQADLRAALKLEED